MIEFSTAIEKLESNSQNFYGLRDIDSLVALISVSHLIEPLTVSAKDDGKYTIISGHRRHAAVVILFLTAMEMLMVRIEFWTMALLTISLLSFGVISQLKFLSEKAIGTMFNLAVKIFVVAFIATLSVNILTGLMVGVKEMKGKVTANIEN